MKRSFGLAVSALICFYLGGCERPQPDLSKALGTAAGTALPSSPASDPSVPSAEAALGARPTAPTSQDDSASASKRELSRAEESTAMPKPGQVNNHSSTALDAGKAASAP